jgi:hypothetical protein
VGKEGEVDGGDVADSGEFTAWGKPVARVRRVDMERANNNAVIAAQLLQRERTYAPSK